MSDRSPADWSGTYRQIIERYGPPLVVINGQDEIVHLSKSAGSFLAFATGELTGNLPGAVHAALQNPLRKVLERSRRSGGATEIKSPCVVLGSKPQVVRIRVFPLGETLPGHSLIAWHADPVLPTSHEADPGKNEGSRLHEELESHRQELGELRALHAAALEKHRTDTDELVAINEELRLASEELEVNRAELQTLNGELTTANGALAGKLGELGRAHSDLQNLVAATAIATVFLDRKLRVTWYTPAATGLFHLMAADVGRPLSDLRCDLDYAGLEADAAQVLADLQPVEREISGKGGNWFLARLLPYRTVDDRIGGVVLTCVDITERRQDEANRQAKEAAERLNQARNEFLSRMSHELRTPLNAILGFGQILELGEHCEEDRKALGLILKAGRHLLALVDEVLDLTRAETGELRLACSPVELECTTRECLQLVSRLAEARQVRCEVEHPAGPLSLLWTDEQRLRQVLLNLLTNAVKYNRPGGRVALSYRRHGDGRYILSVRDNGLGIAADDLPRLFVPFERLHPQHTEAEGTGLGLVITRRLVEALGGTIDVESVPGQGSHFRVELPIGSGSAATAEDCAAGGSVPPGTTAKQGVTLFCIEDNASNLQLVQMVAARHWPHWRFLSARDGDAGLKGVRQHVPNLILLDLQLPDRPGDQVLAELKRDPTTRHLPVVVLSADATARSQERLLALGAARYLTKPFQISDIVQAVEETLISSSSR